jgi:hypothetical protein
MIALWLLMVFNPNGLERVDAYPTKAQCEAVREVGNQEDPGRWFCIPGVA